MKACSFTKLRLHHGCFLCELSKSFRKVFLMCCKNFLKVHKNNSEKMFATYLSADACFVKTTIKNDYLFPDTRAFAFTRQPMKRNFTWSTRAIHLPSCTAFLSRLKFLFPKKLKMNQYIAPTRFEFLQMIETKQKFLSFSKDGAVV